MGILSAFITTRHPCPSLMVMRRAMQMTVLMAGLLGVVAWAQPTAKTLAAPTTPVAATTVPAVTLPAAPEIAARAYLLLDLSSGQMLAQKDIDTPLEPASLTKLMSAYLVFDALQSKKIDIKQTFGVTERAWKMPGSRMFIDPSMKVPVEDLLKGMIVQSGNDATVALAEAVGGTQERFVQLMNEQAKAMGLKNTTYKNPEGLTEAGHSTTARDLSVLASRLMNDFPQYVGFYAIKKYRYEGTPAANDSNRNLLLFRDPSVDGLKTGHTEAAGYCLVATARRDVPGLGEGGKPGSRRLLSVVLGASSDTARANESQKLLNWGYTAFEAVKLFDANQAVATPQVWKGAQKDVKLGRAQAIIVTVPAGSGSKIKTQIARPEPLVAPIAKSALVGTLRVSLSDQALTEVPLMALDGVEQAGLLGRAWDAVRLWIR